MINVTSIYLGQSLRSLQKDLLGRQSLSGKLNESITRYKAIVSTGSIDLEPDEMEILKGYLNQEANNNRKHVCQITSIRYMHDLLEEKGFCTTEAGISLCKKIKSSNLCERIALTERLGY